MLIRTAERVLLAADALVGLPRPYADTWGSLLRARAVFRAARDVEVRRPPRLTGSVLVSGRGWPASA